MWYCIGDELMSPVAGMLESSHLWRNESPAAVALQVTPNGRIIFAENESSILLLGQSARAHSVGHDAQSLAAGIINRFLSARSIHYSYERNVREHVLLVMAYDVLHASHCT